MPEAKVSQLSCATLLVQHVQKGAGLARTTPTHDHLLTSMQRPPIWTKSRERRAAKRYLFGNFTARHLIPNEHYLNRVGLRGRKAWLCLCLFVVIYLIALAHLAVSSL